MFLGSERQFCASDGKLPVPSTRRRLGRRRRWARDAPEFLGQVIVGIIWSLRGMFDLLILKEFGLEGLNL